MVPKLLKYTEFTATHTSQTDLLHSGDGPGSTPGQLLHHQPQQKLQTHQQTSAHTCNLSVWASPSISASPAEPGSPPPSACRRPDSSLAQTRVQPAGGPALHLRTNVHHHHHHHRQHAGRKWLSKGEAQVCDPHPRIRCRR